MSAINNSSSCISAAILYERIQLVGLCGEGLPKYLGLGLTGDNIYSTTSSFASHIHQHINTVTACWVRDANRGVLGLERQVIGRDHGVGFLGTGARDKPETRNR